MTNISFILEHLTQILGLTRRSFPHFDSHFGIDVSTTERICLSSSWLRHFTPRCDNGDERFEIFRNFQVIENNFHFVCGIKLR